jgi:hypothetical protein
MSKFLIHNLAIVDHTTPENTRVDMNMSCDGNAGIAG